MNEKQIFHLLIVDDDKKIRELLGKFLMNNGYLVSLAQDSEEALTIMEKLSADLLIVDVMLPGKTGVELVKILRKVSNVPVVMLTALGETEDRIAGLQAGADDYIAKPFDPQELLLRINRIVYRTHNNRLPITSDDGIYIGNFIYLKSKKTLLSHGNVVKLTTQESEILSILADNLGQIVSREIIAKYLGNLNERSIDVLIKRLRTKIEHNSKNPYFLKTVHGKGYILYGEVIRNIETLQ